MKKVILGIIGLSIVLISFALFAQEAKITVHVTDEAGIAVSNAQVSVGFIRSLKPGEGWGANGENNARSETDVNGLSSVSGQTSEGSIGISVRKDGYYNNGGQTIILTNLSLLRHWEPWNPTLEVVLKKKGVQVPMYSRGMDYIKIPTNDAPVGFDLLAGDWVAPYGKGQTSDFIFTFVSKPEPKVPPRENPPFDVTLTLSFSNEGDGIQSVFTQPHTYSELKLPRNAPVEGYDLLLVRHQQNERGQVPQISCRDDQNYFFRVRTKKDSNGNIVSALYGKIEGDFNQEEGGFIARGRLTFTYFLNPNPNDTNMEFDPKHNLAN